MNHPSPDEIPELARAQITARRTAAWAGDNVAASRRDRRWIVAFLLLLS
jgi:hypothetical protein